jgi:hypothetical protein
MRESESTPADLARRMRGNSLHRGATGLTRIPIESIHAVVARAIWPDKTAENWAAEAGRKPRVAKMWLKDPELVSEAGKLALIRLLG